MLYMIGDEVEFKFNGKHLRGKVYTADFMGSMENDYHSYDVMVTADQEEHLYKHLPEADLVRLIRPGDRKRFDGHEIGWRTEDGTYNINTESESTYVLKLADRTATLRRINDERHMRKDGSDIKVLDFFVIQGNSAVFVLEPLGKGPVTTRMTSKVIQIQKGQSYLT